MRYQGKSFGSCEMKNDGNIVEYFSELNGEKMFLKHNKIVPHRKTLLFVMYLVPA